MVVANGTVDLVALKARHPLGDAVEAAGVRLRGRGRVRQGVCPFPDESEGSFTVYGDTEKFYCFGCGDGGDVLDFIQRVEGLSLPDAIRRLDGGGAVLRRAASAHSCGEGVPCLQGRRHGRRLAAGPRLHRRAARGLRPVHGAARAESVGAAVS